MRLAVLSPPPSRAGRAKGLRRGLGGRGSSGQLRPRPLHLPAHYGDGQPSGPIAACLAVPSSPAGRSKPQRRGVASRVTASPANESWKPVPLAPDPSGPGGAGWGGWRCGDPGAAEGARQDSARGSDMDRMASSMKQVSNPLPKVLSRRTVGAGVEAAERESFERAQVRIWGTPGASSSEAPRARGGSRRVGVLQARSLGEGSHRCSELKRPRLGCIPASLGVPCPRGQGRGEGEGRANGTGKGRMGEMPRGWGAIVCIWGCTKINGVLALGYEEWGTFSSHRDSFPVALTFPPPNPLYPLPGASGLAHVTPQLSLVHTGGPGGVWSV